MLTISPSTRIYIASCPVDMRKSIDGLAAVAEHELRGKPRDGDLFVFVSRSCDRVKILAWDRNGFVVYYKRFERGKVRLPHIGSDDVRVQIDATQLTMLLAGIEYGRVPRPKAWEPMDKIASP